MSRIRGIETKKKKEPGSTCEKDDVEKQKVADLMSNIPNLAKTFEIHKKIGEGTFSTVYLGSLRQQAGLPDEEKQFFAIKYLVPTPYAKVAHELRCLRDMGGINHVIGVQYCFRNHDHVVFVMPYIPHRKFSEYVGIMEADELCEYMRALLTALQHVHSFGVIHRDVKPSNFLYDRERRRYALIDFGLAQHTVPAQPPPAHQAFKRPREDAFLPEPAAKRSVLDLTKRPRSPTRPPGTMQPAVDNWLAFGRSAQAVPAAPRSYMCFCAGLGGVCTECLEWAPPRANRAGTQGFRPPEVFFKYPYQSTAVDMWAAGVVLVSVLCGRYPFFRATDDMSALAEITAMLGKEAMEGAARALGCRMLTSTNRYGICLRKLATHLRGPRVKGGNPCGDCRVPVSRCICLYPHDDEAHMYDPQRSTAGFPDSAFSLAARLLDPNPRTRITAADALRHPFLWARVAPTNLRSRTDQQ